MMNQFLNSLDENLLYNITDYQDYSVYGSYLGVLLYYVERDLPFESDHIIRILDGLNLSQKDKDCSIITGLSGVVLFFDILQKRGYIDDIVSIIDLEEIDVLIYNSVVEDIENNNYDFFYGYLGKGIYALMRGNNEVIQSIVENIRQNGNSHPN